MIRKLQCTSPRAFLAFGVLMSVVMAGAFAIAGQLALGLACGGILLAYTLLVVLGRRWSPTLEILSGSGDERTQGIVVRASARAGAFVALVTVVWWLVTVALGRANQTLNLLAAVFGVAFIIAVAALQRRS